MACGRLAEPAAVKPYNDTSVADGRILYRDATGGQQTLLVAAWGERSHELAALSGGQKVAVWGRIEIRKTQEGKDLRRLTISGGAAAGVRVAYDEAPEYCCGTLAGVVQKSFYQSRKGRGEGSLLYLLLSVSHVRNREAVSSEHRVLVPCADEESLAAMQSECAVGAAVTVFGEHGWAHGPVLRAHTVYGSGASFEVDVEGAPTSADDYRAAEAAAADQDDAEVGF